MLFTATLSVYNNAIQNLTTTLLNNAIVSNPMKQIGSHFTLNDQAVDKEALDKTSIQQLHFAGYLIENNHIHGVLRSVTGKAWVVMTGMKIGLEKATVLTVNESGVVLDNEDIRYLHNS